MAKYTFTCQHMSLYDKPIDKVTYELEADSLSTVIQGFEHFLKGSGFCFDGMLDVVPHEADDLDDNVVLLSAHNEDRI